jgi:hypothetical protein
MAAIVAMQAIGFAIGKALVNRWLVGRETRRAAKPSREKITVVKFAETGN